MLRRRWLLGGTIGALPADDQKVEETKETFHAFDRPEMSFSSTPCATEMGAYLAALGALEAAQDVADDAWAALQECLSGTGGGTGEEDPEIETFDNLE